MYAGAESGFGFPSSAVWFDDGQFGFSVLLAVVCVFNSCLVGRTTEATGQSGAAMRVSPLHGGKSSVLTCIVVAESFFLVCKYEATTRLLA